MKKVEKVKPQYATTKFSTRMFEGRRFMICQNSEPGGKYYREHICNTWTAVGNDANAVICWKCVAAVCEGPVVRASIPKSDKPKGWKFMKEYVATDGTVYHKGEEQTSLKGTLPVTVIEPKPEKKKLSKQEKSDAFNALGKDIEKLKVQLFHETRKGKKAELMRSLSKANRQLKKLM
jgi:hypothetical protein